jgi:hypothetical protein
VAVTVLVREKPNEGDVQNTKPLTNYEPMGQVASSLLLQGL